MTWVDPLRHVTVTCGSTEAMIASIPGILDPGDEVILFEPYYENNPNIGHIYCAAIPPFGAIPNHR